MKVSIIVPVYNSEKYVAECLDSILKQTMKELQIICVNDASTDSSREILEKYAKKDQRIMIVDNEQNGGLSFARNRGMEKATGEYIYFLDSDDSIVPEAMEELYNRAQELDTDVIFFDSEMTVEGDLISEDKRLFCAKKNYGENNVYRGIELARKMQLCNDYRVPVWLQFWKRAFVERAGLQFYDRLIYEDELFTYLSLMQAERVACVAKTYHIYRRHSDTITMGKIKPDYIKSMLIIIQEITSYWNGHQGVEIDGISNKIIRGLEWQINEFLKKMPETVEELQQLWGEESIYSHYLGIIYRPVAEQRTNEAETENRLFTEQNLVKLATADRRYIYGAGKFARSYIRYLKELGILFDGIIVTDRENNPDELEGIKIYDLAELKRCKEKYEVLIGVSKKYAKEVEQTLIDNSIEQYVIAGE